MHVPALSSVHPVDVYLCNQSIQPFVLFGNKTPRSFGSVCRPRRGYIGYIVYWLDGGTARMKWLSMACGLAQYMKTAPL